MYKLILILFGLLTVSGLEAQSLSLTLEQAQQMAVDSSYATRDARYNTAKREKEVKEILAIGLPQINGKAEYQNFLDIPTSLVPGEAFGGDAGSLVPVQFGTEHNLNVGFTASQLLFDGTYIIGLEASKVYVQFTEHVALRTEMDIRVSVAEAYNTVLLAEANLEILEGNIESLEKTLSDTEALYEAGLSEQQDVDQIKLNLNRFKINVDQTTRFLQVSEQLLNFIIGIPLSQEIILADKIENLVQLSNNETYLSRDPNLNTHPDFLIAQTNLKLQDLNIRAEKAAYYPSLNAFYNYQQVGQGNDFNFFSSDGDWFPTSILGATLNVPIFSSFSRKNKVAQAEIGYMQAELAYTQTQESLELEVRITRSNYDNSLKVWENQKESMELARSISEKTQIKYSEGVATSFELNVAEQQLLTEQQNYISAALDVLTAKQELDRALNIY